MIPVLPQKTAFKRDIPARVRPNWLSMRLLVLLLLIAIPLSGIVGEVVHQLIPARAASGDWPTFLHDNQRTAAASDTTITTGNASQLTKKWAFQTGGPIAASPTVVGGIVYVGSWDGYEYALNATTGALVWKHFLGQTTAPCYPQLAGVSSAADVENGVVYVGGGDSNWYALNAATGAVLWSVFVGDNTKGWYNWASPLIYNGYAYIGTSSVGDCPLIPGQLLKVSLTTHTVVNSVTFVPQGQVGAGVWTTPSIDTSTNTIFVTTGTRNQDTQNLAEAVIAVDANTLAIKSSWAVPNSMQTADSDFGNTPLLFNDSHGNPLVTAVNKNGFDYAWNRNNLAAGPVWTQTVTLPGSCPQCGDGSASSGAFANGMLFQAGGSTVINGVGYRGSVRALNPDNGNFLWQHGDSDPVIPGLAYSNGLIFDGAGSTFEVLDASSGTRLYSYTTGGYLYAAPSISNGQVYIGGTDNNVYAFGLGTPTTPPPDPNCPSSWTCQDIGNPLPAGKETVSGPNWSVQAGGAGVAGTSDQFRFISQTISGNSQVSAQIVSQQLTSGSAQAGLMVRQTNGPTSPYYEVVLEPNNMLAVQYRTAFGGPTTTVTLSNFAPPLYLEIQRVGDQFQAAASSNSSTYTLLSGTTATLPMPASVMEGVAGASGSQGTSNTVAVSAVTLGSPTTPPNPPASPSPCPGGWSCQDIGNPVAVGDQSLSSGSWTVKGAGQSINNYGDQFHFVWQSLAANGTISAHVTAQTNTNASAQAGVMLRQSTDPGAAYYAAFVTPGSGIVVQYRLIQGLKTTAFSGPSVTVPVYLMVARSGSNYCTYTSSNGVNWSVIIGSCATVSLSGSVLAGLAVSSDNTGSLSTVSMDTVALSTTAPPPPNICTGAWNCADIGYPSLTGSQYLIGSTWTLQGSGSDIWSAYDQFRYVWQALAGDGSLSAHITSQVNSDPWAKAGVMMRLSTDPGSPYYAVLATPGNGIVVQYRATLGGLTQDSGQLTTGTVPTYLKVTRSGTTYSAYTSADGVNWTLVPGSSIAISGMSGSNMAGLVDTPHNSLLMGSATFDTVTYSTSTVSCPTSWSCADIGNPIPAGGQSVSNGSWTMTAGGNDIWGASDTFHFAWQPLSGNGTVSSQVSSQTNSDPWSKSGVMLRQSSDPAAMYYGAFVTPANGIVVQYRSAQGGTTQQVKITGTVPVYLAVQRAGTTYSAYTSSNGTAWTLVAGSSVTVNMTGTVLAGIAATSHNSNILLTTVFSSVNVGPGGLPVSCPTSWSCADIGGPALAGNQAVNGSTWTVKAGGTDIWGTSDQFHYVWQQLAGNGSANAQVLTQTNSSTWAKAGVMIRQDISASSAYYYAAVTPGNGIVVQYRTAAGAGSGNLVYLSGTVPVYLAVARVGSTFTAYTSSNGTTWTQVAGSSVTINMTGTVLAGIAATSHNATVLETVTLNSAYVGTAIP